MVKSKIFIVDDHPLVREWLAVLINRTSDLVICGEAEDLNTAVLGIADSNPDLAIVDLSLGCDSGFELIRILKEEAPAVAAVVLSIHDEDAYAVRAIRAGARGYIVKRESTSRIVDAIRVVLNGGIYISQELNDRFVQKLSLGSSRTDHTPIKRLSNRELEVFQLVGRGYDRREIAEQLNVNIGTVQTFCARIKEKMGLNSGAELVREAIRWNGDILA